MFKSYVAILCFMGVAGFVEAVNAQQVISLDRCREMAVREHDFEHRNQVLGLEAEARVSYLKKMVKPQASAFVVFSYQSDVPDPNSALEFGFDFIPLAKDQYRSGVYVKQQLYDGGEYRFKKELIGLDYKVGENDVFREKLLLENNVDNLFFNIVLISKSSKIIESQIDLIEERVGHAKTLYNNGKVLITEVLQLELAADELRVTRDELVSNDLRLRSILSVVTGMNISASDSLVIPNDLFLDDIKTDPFYERFDIENRRVELSEKLSLSSARPKAYVFGIGGYARPALDVFNNSPDVYGVAGISLVIPITAWKDHKNHKKIMNYKVQLLDNAFRIAGLNRSASLAGIEGEIGNLLRTLSNDIKLIEKHREIRCVSTKLHDLGEISSAEVKDALTRESNARIEMERHSLELLKAKIRRNRLVTEFKLGEY